MLLTEEQLMIQDTVRAFAREKLAPNSEAWAEAGALPLEVFKEMGELGLMGMTVPAQWDGAEMDYVSYAIALMEVAAGDASVATVMSVNNAPVCAAILGSGTEAQKERFLKPLARGDAIGAFCLTEPQAGSDASALKTRAEKIDGGYRINGSKQFITSGKIAKVAVLFAVTDSAAGKKGISAFVVPTDTPGFKVTRLEKKMGQEASDTALITFDNMEVAEDALLGEEGQGYAIALANLETGRIGIGSQCYGIGRAALEAATRYAQERTSFGKPLIQHQAVAFRLADMATQLEAARLMTLSAAALKEAGQPCLKEACMAKLFASEAVEKVCSDAIQTLGGYGYLRDFPVERYYRDSRVCQIYEGTSDIQKMIISRSLMD